MQVGDRDNAQEQGAGVTPRIVRFAGMHPLPVAERWGYPSGQAEYPLAAFHFAGDGAAEGFTLCFEDRDGVRGLHVIMTCKRAESPQAGASHSRCGSRPTNSKAFSRPAPECPTSGRCSGSTPATERCAPRCTPSAATTRKPPR